MLAYDFTPLLRTAIGFERLARQAQAAAGYDDDAASYPPYNIESSGDDRYRITLAVAGFARNELDIEVKESTLIISGRKPEEDETVYNYRGISTRSFVRKFELADHVQVVGASLVDGLLAIDLKRELPDEKKPRKVEIGAEAPKSLIDKAKRLIEPAMRKNGA